MTAFSTDSQQRFLYVGNRSQAKVMVLDDTRRTPAHVKADGSKYYPTQRWVLFGHHFAAIAGAGPLSSVLGPADWTHGIARPLENVVADPNPNLTVQLLRQPLGGWLGVQAQARWKPVTGLGIGSGTLLDVHGEIGRVSMSVVLVPFPKPAMAAN